MKTNPTQCFTKKNEFGFAQYGGVINNLIFFWSDGVIMKEILINVDCFLLTCKYKYANLNNDNGVCKADPCFDIWRYS